MTAGPHRADHEDAGPRFAAAVATGPDWGHTVKACLDRLASPPGANFGFLYVSDALAGDATSIVTLLRGVTGIRDWTGTVGMGICGNGEELFDQPAVAIMTARLPPDSFRPFPVVTGDLHRFRRATGSWAERHAPMFGIVHGDPRNPHIAELVDSIGEASGAFLVGGLTSSRGEQAQFLGAPGIGPTMRTEGPTGSGGVSGVLFDARVPVATGLTQGCSPIGPVHTVTACDGNVIQEIDGRPALGVFKEDIGELLARDLRRVSGYIFAALPIAGSDTGDYLVRNLIAIDPRHGWLAIGEMVEPGQPVLFTRRDQPAAQTDLERMLNGLKRRLADSPRGALYVSCLARGANMFGDPGRELEIIRDAIGEVPLVGFFANGEISHNRLYSYTGVLTLFL